TVLAVWQAGGFVKDKVSPGESVRPGEARPVLEETTVELVRVPRFHEVVGTIHSRDEVDVSPRITARVVSITKRSGETVTKGEVMVQLDDTDLKATHEGAVQALDAAKSALSTARSREIGARASFEVAKKDYERMKQLVESGTIPKSRYDKAEGDFLAAQAVLEQTAFGISIADADVRRAAENVNAAQAVLDYTVLRAPLSGIVSDRLADPGDMATVGNPVLKVFDPERLMLEAGVREDLVQKVTIGMKARFAVQALGREYEGDVREIVPSVDPSSRTFLVKVCLGKSESLMPGMFGRLFVPLGEEEVLLVPERYLTRIGQLEYLDVRTTSGAVRRLVKTLPHGKDMLRVISGLSPGETIVRLGRPT
ncbi:MAG TPA: efflux RND transporter periplasmic adaptor subunit, partial [Planctomycetota bacterium]|nr:efflux RND transporter periplasmic adaptor subunit [Planctomycetota bacterium]